MSVGCLLNVLKCQRVWCVIDPLGCVLCQAVYSVLLDTELQPRFSGKT